MGGACVVELLQIAARAYAKPDSGFALSELISLVASGPPLEAASRLGALAHWLPSSIRLRGSISLIFAAYLLQVSRKQHNLKTAER